MIFDKIEEQLSYEPDVRTRNRKPLRGSTLFGEGVWELRFGPNNRFRVFYGSDAEAKRAEVYAVGIKEGNRLLIAGKEVTL